MLLKHVSWSLVQSGNYFVLQILRSLLIVFPVWSFWNVWPEAGNALFWLTGLGFCLAFFVWWWSRFANYLIPLDRVSGLLVLKRLTWGRNCTVLDDGSKHISCEILVCSTRLFYLENTIFHKSLRLFRLVMISFCLMCCCCYFFFLGIVIVLFLLFLSNLQSPYPL